MNRNLSRRIITALAGPAVATGILAGTLAVSAPAEAAGTTGTTECSAVAMPPAAPQSGPNTFNLPC
ncbi:hypothetical protein OG976_14380 [Mycobacterium sp. NBC_00419]|uniref:hypothetical protein n=1 Tax=Mycobacterium sp. NBC_00419 TaxID=2975989 RepID=UPI002E20EBAD